MCLCFSFSIFNFCPSKTFDNLSPLQREDSPAHIYDANIPFHYLAAGLVPEFSDELNFVSPIEAICAPKKLSTIILDGSYEIWNIRNSLASH